MTRYDNNKIRGFSRLLASSKTDANKIFSVYLDNATIINACAILSYPHLLFDPYKLLDLESFCEAFLFYDQVHTLVGSSFIYAVGLDTMNLSKWLPKSPHIKPNLDTGTLYSELINNDLLVPVEIGASATANFFEKREIFDEVAANINIEETIEQVTSVFGDRTPWVQKLHTIITGDGTYVSDTYPSYTFPVRMLKKTRSIDEGRTGGLENFVSQTFFYIVSASLMKRPYLCSSVRAPIVHDVVSRLNKRFFSVIHASLGAISQ